MATEYKLIKSHFTLGVLDINQSEKDRRKLPTYSLNPVWRWFWFQLSNAGIDVQDIKIDFQVKNDGSYFSTDYQCLLIYMDHYIPIWLLNLVSNIKKEKPEILLIMCGFLPTLKADEIKRKMPEIDYILEGPLELVLEEFVKNIYKLTGKSEIDTHISDTIVYPNKSDLNINTINNEIFMDFSSGIVQASVGCPRVCSFCRYSAFYHKYYPKIYQQYPISIVIDEMKYLYEEYRIRHFRFSDSNFLGSGRLIYQRAKELKDAIEKNNLKITFEMHCRSDGINEEVLNCLVSAGLLYVSIGIESMSAAQLERFEKGETVADHFNAIKLFQNKGVIVQGYSILADPLVTRQELIENLQGLYELSEKILVLINEKMILYSTTNYYRKHKGKIISSDYIENTMNIIVDYNFCDDWCNNYFYLVEDTSIWLYKKILENYHNKAKKMTSFETYHNVQRATQYRLSVLMDIVNMDIPDIEKIKKLKMEALEKIYTI